MKSSYKAFLPCLSQTAPSPYFELRWASHQRMKLKFINCFSEPSFFFFISVKIEAIPVATVMLWHTEVIVIGTWSSLVQITDHLSCLISLGTHLILFSQQLKLFSFNLLEAALVKANCRIFCGHGKMTSGFGSVVAATGRPQKSCTRAFQVILTCSTSFPLPASLTGCLFYNM